MQLKCRCFILILGLVHCRQSERLKSLAFFGPPWYRRFDQPTKTGNLLVSIPFFYGFCELFLLGLQLQDYIVPSKSFFPQTIFTSYSTRFYPNLSPPNCFLLSTEAPAFPEIEATIREVFASVTGPFFQKLPRPPSVDSAADLGV